MEVKIVETEAELDQAYTVRTIVFVEEQNVDPAIEMDEHEKASTHFIGYENDEPIAASRLRFMDDYGKLERICVLQPFRGRTFGKQIINEMEQSIKNKGYKKAKLNAQTHAEEFYKALGYRTISDEFLDAGIPHVTMIKEL
ncbi:GNAT family N-acetyltransferase [Aquibacillus sp. 3ASR75-11]|uniref:GNAT family N-acetyltransferase n=1 Tax=Terrihalobacillus insolitus TaxID=2950438 RepID=A0A9X4APE8_9BACI|nr:GNAT family N-acetyltransferase [Terrihalobacillus insolitus]MDC3413655.1 GNAT family N-acetyltransferase [Terrihalobacillus insolitus]MDC3425470.1 GNAT family N-acetyltransferase [Terrihalobacillus insolitus]